MVSTTMSVMAVIFMSLMQIEFSSSDYWKKRAWQRCSGSEGATWGLIFSNCFTSKKCQPTKLLRRDAKQVNGSSSFWILYKILILNSTLPFRSSRPAFTFFRSSRPVKSEKFSIFKCEICKKQRIMMYLCHTYLIPLFHVFVQTKYLFLFSLLKEKEPHMGGNCTRCFLNLGNV